MKKKKWVMRWQASLMPDPSMIPDATIFKHTLQHNTPTTQASTSAQLSQPSTSDQHTDRSKQRKKSPGTKKQAALVVEETSSYGEDMAIELDPSFMSFLQEEEMN